MLHDLPRLLPIAEPLPLLEAALLFLIQVLLARHPDLLAADPNDDTQGARNTLSAPPTTSCSPSASCTTPSTRYRAILPTISGSGPTDDDFPF